MADYWKSTPRYWCKHCKQFVKDTPLEKRNHESSPRHQGNLQRFVKDLHKSNAREEREAQRAKDEVARLNGVQPSASKPPIRTTAAGGGAGGGGGSKQAPKATPEDRRRQMAQLAAMGVVVPEGFRKENAMAGDWETVAVHPTAAAPPPRPKVDLKKEDDDDEDVKPGLVDSTLSERKRKLDEGEGEGDFLARGKRKPNWGSDVKHQRDVDADADLNALLASSSKVLGRATGARDDPPVEEDSNAAEETTIKSEEPDIKAQAADLKNSQSEALVKEENGEKSLDPEEDIGSMFKKRKKKALKDNA